MLTGTRRTLAAVAITATGVAGLLVAAGGTATAATSCAIEYAVTSQWPGGFVASVTIRNLGDPVSGWRLTWSYGAGQQVTSAWSATISQSGAQLSAVGASYNRDLGAGASTSFGFQGTWTDTNPAPAGFALGGVACVGGTAPSTAPATTRPPTSGPTATPSPSGPAPTTPTPSGQPGCPAAGRITYTLNRAANPTSDQLSAYALITTAMDQALAVYNCQTNIRKALTVSYDPSVPTADGNQNGNIRFGARSTMQQITAMHEISHTLGVGASAAWSARLSNGVWTGANATNALRTLTGDPSAVLRGDAWHFWPYGLNYTSEVTSPQDLVIHCRIVVGLRADLGLT